MFERSASRLKAALQVRLGRPTPWYLGRALKGRGGNRPGVRASGGAVAAATVLVLSGCGGPPRQDVDEPAGVYPVEISEASFPTNQKLARTSILRITVRNVGTKTIPNANVWVSTGGAGGSHNSSVGGFNYRDMKNEDPNKPIFVINKEPKGGETAYVNTWALGSIRPGRAKSFVWNVTALKAMPFDLRYRVQAGLDGKAKAVQAGTGAPVEGRFRGTVTSEAPDAKVADSGKDIVSDGAVYPPRKPGRSVPER
jgi:hypothetical protein